jgi:hypothetical protein
MKNVRLAILVLCAGISAGVLSSCRFTCVHGSGKEASETRNVGRFSRIEISGGYKIVLKQDSSYSLKITADDNLLKYIKTDIEGSGLRIHSRKNMCNSGQIIVNIGVGNLDEIDASGGVEVEGDGKINTKDIMFKMAGATKVKMNLNAAHVTTRGSGSTELYLTGQAASHDIDLTGAGTVKALDFVVSTCNIQTSGVGHCEVNVLNTLNVHSTGASSVKYRGNPSNITNNKLGASSLEKVD